MAIQLVDKVDNTELFANRAINDENGNPIAARLDRCIDSIFDPIPNKTTCGVEYLGQGLFGTPENMWQGLSTSNNYAYFYFHDQSYVPTGLKGGSSHNQSREFTESTWTLNGHTLRLWRVTLPNNLSNLNYYFYKTFGSDYTGPDVDLVCAGIPLTANYMFKGCTKLKSIGTIKWTGSRQTLSSGDFTGFFEMFRGCTGLRRVQSINLGNGVAILRSMFADCSSLEEVKDITFNSGYADNVDLQFMFSNCEHLLYMPNMYYFYGRRFAKMSNMFEKCYSFKGRRPDAVYDSDKDYSDQPCVALDAGFLFYDCRSMREMPFPKLTVNGGCTYMFFNCWSLDHTPNISLANGLDISSMFYACRSLERLPGWFYTAAYSPSNMFSAFDGCTSLVEIPTFNVSSCTDCSHAFKDCTNVVSGALEMYTALSQVSGIAHDTDTFWECGLNSRNDQRSQIPTSWGGTMT